MGKGILLEMAGRQAVVLTPQGEFLKVPVPVGNWDIGDEIEFAEVRQQPAWMRWGTAAAAAAVLFVGSLTGWNVYSLAQPVAVVTVDINPSLELTLNKNDQVLKVVPKNADGELILKGVDFKRKPFEEVLTALTDRAVEERKLNPVDEAGTVVVGVAPAKESELPSAVAERVVDKAKSAVKTEVEKVAKAQGQAPKASVVVLAATADEKEEAEKEGLSVGKFKILPAIQQVAPDVTPEQIKQSGPGRILKDHNINPGTVFGNAQKENDEDRNNKGKDKDQKSQKDDEKAEPASGTPDDKKGSEEKKDDKAPAQGGGQDPKKDDKPSETKNNNGAQQNNTPGADKKTDSSTQKVDSGKSNGNDKAGTEKKDEPKNQTPKKDEPKKDDGKKNSWTIPWLGITIEKPAFLRDKDEDKPAAAVEAPAPSTPRAEEPGVGASQSPKHEELKQEEPKKEEPKQEQPKKEEPKKEEPKQEQPKKEEPKQEQPKQEQPKQEQPKQEQPKQEEPKQEQPKQEQPKQEEPKQEQPKQEEPKKEEPKQEEPKKEEPKKEEPKKEEPKKDEPKADSGKDSEKDSGKGNQQDSGKEKGKDK